MQEFTINTGINTDSFITGYSRNGRRPVRHLRIEDDNTFIKIYSVGELIGKGTFGTVFEVRDMKDNKLWASKVIDKKCVPVVNMKVLEREINILKVLNHPHIIHLREILESSTKIYLIMEKCVTDLLKVTHEKGSNFGEDNIRRVIYDLTSAVSYLHKHDIVHRDVKLENVLVTDNPDNLEDHLYIKLSDFGLSIVKSGHGVFNMMMLHERCGTLPYMSPEMLSSKSYSQQCDVWSIGVITYYLVTSNMPFEGRRESDVIERICNTEPVFSHQAINCELKDLLLRVLNKDPASRITAAEMLHHPWLHGKKLVDSTQSHNVIDMMRLCNNDMRVSVEDDNNDPILSMVQRPQANVSVKNLTFDKRNSRKSDAPSNKIDRKSSTKRSSGTHNMRCKH